MSLFANPRPHRSSTSAAATVAFIAVVLVAAVGLTWTLSRSVGRTVPANPDPVTVVTKDAPDGTTPGEVTPGDDSRDDKAPAPVHAATDQIIESHAQAIAEQLTTTAALSSTTILDVDITAVLSSYPQETGEVIVDATASGDFAESGLIIITVNPPGAQDCVTFDTQGTWDRLAC